MVRTTTGVECESCGLTAGHHEARGAARCGECGRFAESSSDYCAQHEVDLTNLPTGYSSCPYCQERRRVEQERQEMMERRADPRMHPSVDAPRW